MKKGLDTVKIWNKMLCYLFGCKPDRRAGPGEEWECTRCGFRQEAMKTECLRAYEVMTTCGTKIRVIGKKVPTDSQGKLWRALFRVVADEGSDVWVVIPSRNPRVTHLLMKEDIPDEIAKKIGVGYRFHAQCNLGAREERDIRIEGPWESE